MSDSTVPRIAVVGCGYWGRNLVRNFHALGALAAVVDETPAGRGLAAQLAPGVLVAADLGPLLAQRDIDGIALATPAVTHAPLGVRVLNAGKDLFVEKPMALELADGRALVERAAKGKRILQVGHLLEYHPAVTTLKSWLKDGRLGRVQRLHAHRLNFGKVRTEEDALWSLAPHDISVLLRLHEAPVKSVSCTGTRALGRAPADFAVSVLHFADGVDAHLLSSWLHPTKEQKIVVIGERGMAVFDDTSADQKLTFFDQGVEWKNERPELRKNPPHVEPLLTSEPLRLECSAFLDAIATRKPPVADGVSGLRVLAVLDACRRSMEADGRATTVENS
jgi:UDP-2-acetamido-3-amino-2,3-dideoxy-glucuronate N-acetyltransferase